MPYDTPHAYHTSNPGVTDYWTCPGCYTNLSVKRPGTVTCPTCLRKVACTLEYQPVCHSELVEEEE